MIPQHRLRLINFNTFFNQVSYKILDSIQWYLDLTQDTKLSKPIKQFILHHLINETIQFITTSKSNNKTVFVVSPVYRSRLHLFISNKELDHYLNKILLQIQKKLPIKIYFAPTDSTWYHITGLTLDGYWAEQMQLIKLEANKDYKLFTFEKIKDFAKKNGLRFLTEQTFNNIKTGQLLFA